MQKIQLKFYNQLNRMSSISNIILLFAIAHALLLSMMVYTFPRINEKLNTLAFDLLTFGYSVSETKNMLQNLDQTTTDFYIFPQLLFLDLLYPFFIALFLSTFIIRLSNQIKSKKKIFSKLYLLPFIAMCADYLENVFILKMITHSNNISSVTIKTASVLTQLKGFFTMLSWIILFILLGIWLSAKLRSRETWSIKKVLKSNNLKIKGQ